MSPPCPACNGAQFHELIDFGIMPRSGIFLSNPEQAAPTRRLRFEYCEGCALVRQHPLPSYAPDYTHVSRPTARQLPSYAPDIISRLIAATQVNDLIVEVGANDGTFLSVLAQAGFESRLGIEPSHSLAVCGEQSGHEIVVAHLDQQSAQAIRAQRGAAAAVLCRHTLEHVADPTSLLRAMATLLADEGLLFVEVPDTQPVIDTLRGFELWDEHLFYFSMANLRRLLAQCGFAVEHMQSVHHRNSQNIICWARKRQRPQNEIESPGTLIQACRAFRRRWSAYSEALQAQSHSWMQPVFATGASHPQSNFLLFTGIGHQVSGLVDEDPVKLGKWVALPQAVRISHPSELDTCLTRGTLLLTAFGYPDWTQSMRRKFASVPVRLVAPFNEATDEHRRNSPPFPQPHQATLER
jgi:Methyltransferase domain